MKSRYWQMIRGICILAVIMIHCPAGESGVSQTIWLALRQLINFPVAIFVFMAGYFVKAEKATMTWTYLKNRGGGTTACAVPSMEYAIHNKKYCIW